MNFIDTLINAIWEPFLLVLSPQQRVFWPFLLGSIVLALWVIRKERNENSLKNILAFIVPPHIWTHASALLDYKLLFAKALIRALLIAPWAISAFGLSVWFVGLLDSTFGIVHIQSLSKSMVMVFYTLTLFLAWDLSRYLLHRLLHEVPFLWEIHQVHHSAEVLTPLTLYRSHPIESALYTLRGILVVSMVTGIFFYFFRTQTIQFEILGVNLAGFVFNLAGGNLRHSHIWLSYGRKMEHIFISPAQHQVHHSRNPRHARRNYGTWLAVWDWFGKSLYTTGPKEDLILGVKREELNHHPYMVRSALLAPLLAGIKRIYRTRATIIS